MFLIFCYASPLLLAASMNLFFFMMRTVRGKWRSKVKDTEKDWLME
jgi:hypothetical protein